MNFARPLALAAAMTISAGAVDLPGAPFKLAVSADGKTVYASLIGQPGHNTSGLAVLRQSTTGLELDKVIKTSSALTGLVLTHDGKHLIATNGKGVSIFDVAALDSKPQQIETGEGAVYVNIAPDDKTVFVSNERARSISVIDFPTRSVLNSIQVGNAPIALTFSPGGQLLYTTSQSATPGWQWPAVCDAETGPLKPKHPAGAIVVIDVNAARSDPTHAVVNRIEAGCNPVRLALSPGGEHAYVTSRKDNVVLVYATAGFRGKAPQSPIARIAVGESPVPVVVLPDGKTVVAGNSNRFSNASARSSLSVIDAATLQLKGTLSTGAFPRDLVVSPDGARLYVANFGAAKIDVLPLPLEIH